MQSADSIRATLPTQIGTFLHDSASFTCCRHHAWSECCRRRQTEVEEEIQQTAPSWENSISRDFSPPAGKDSVSKRYYWKAFADWSERRRRIFRFISSSKDSIRKSFFLGFLLADILADEEQKEVKTSKTTSSFCVRILLLFLGHDFASDKNFLISSELASGDQWSARTHFTFCNHFHKERHADRRRWLAGAY